jgi:hypothetical protein
MPEVDKADFCEKKCEGLVGRTGRRTSCAHPDQIKNQHNTQAVWRFRVAEQYKTIDMWRRTGRGGTHVAVLETAVMISFSFATPSTLAITAPIEHLCDKNE